MNDNLKILPLRDSYVEGYIKKIEMCTDPSEGFLHFAELYVKVYNPITGLQHIELYDFQRSYLMNMHKERLSINLMARQMGKTMCAAIYIAWRAIFFDHQSIVVASNHSISSKVILNSVRVIIENCPAALVPNLIVDNKTEFRLDNGSRILAKPTRTNDLKGLRPDFLYLDEFAFVKSDDANDFLYSVLPCMASKGQVAIASTPNQPNDTFAKIWESSQKQSHSFKPFKATWRDHPNRDANWGAIQVSQMGQSAFDKEYECIL